MKPSEMFEGPESTLRKTFENTKDSEWEKELRELWLNVGDYGELKKFVTSLLTSRDTYWKERVRALRKELWHDYHNAQKWSEQKAVADALDTLLERVAKDWNKQAEDLMDR